MNWRIVLLAAGVALLTVLVFVAAPLQTAAPSPSSLLPAGPLLCLEAKDFARELRDWNDSPEQKAWLAGVNSKVQGDRREVQL